jgi:multicomponent K+:H+ antiporter subunit E
MIPIARYPLLTVGLLLMWLLLTRFSLGNVLLGGAIALVATAAMTSLQPAKPRLRRWGLLPRLLSIVLYDILRSALAVSWLILRGDRDGARRRSGFIEIPLDLRDPTGLALLAIITTATPGTAWMRYESRRGMVLLHVLDLVDEAEWVDLVKNRYEHLLIEIFE